EQSPRPGGPQAGRQPRQVGGPARGRHPRRAGDRPPPRPHRRAGGACRAARAAARRAPRHLRPRRRL
ncbi:MAG: hypothetical protein AVDCRST_MAG19-1754, partial [uncultured Thermomicrobiales bacterium]